MSLLMPDRPTRPDFLLRMLSISWMSVMPSFSMMHSSTAGSRSPEREPMITPSRGVRPMDVSTHLPPLIADSDEPLPRWQMTNLQSSGFLPSICGTTLAT